MEDEKVPAQIAEERLARTKLFEGIADNCKKILKDGGIKHMIVLGVDAEGNGLSLTEGSRGVIADMLTETVVRIALGAGRKSAAASAVPETAQPTAPVPETAQPTAPVPENAVPFPQAEKVAAEQPAVSVPE